MPGRELEGQQKYLKSWAVAVTPRVRWYWYEAHGGLVADTPGFASLDMAHAAAIPKENLELAFQTLPACSGSAALRAVLIYLRWAAPCARAVHRGEISRTRYESYAALYEQAKEQEKR